MLHYSSKRTQGYQYQVDLPLDLSDMPISAIEAIVQFEIAGKQYEKIVSPSATNVSFTWDGKNILDKSISGKIIGRLRIGYRYNLAYSVAASGWSTAWARSSGVAMTLNGGREFIGRQNVILWSNYDYIDIYAESGINNLSIDKNISIANGWMFSGVNHSFLKMILEGNGEIIKESEVTSQIINTFAGQLSFTGGFSGDGGSAKDATLVDPRDVALDGKGNLYITTGKRIRKVDANGIITTIAGTDTAEDSGDGGLAINASLKSSRGIDVDSQGNIYFVSQISPNPTIRKIDTNGIITRVAGGYYWANPSGKEDNILAIEATLSTVGDITVDKEGNLYLAEYNTIRKIDSDGVITTVAGNGSSGYSGDGGAAIEASFNKPISVATDNNGNLYIADRNNYRIRKVDTNGIITTVAGNGSNGYSGDGGDAREASLEIPNHISVDSYGNLFISCNDVVRKVDTNGIITTVVGKPFDNYWSYDENNILATEAILGDVRGTAIDSNGDIYVATTRHDVRRTSTPPLFDIYHLDGHSILYRNIDNTADIFDISGKHLKTIDMNTGNNLKEFTYNTNGYLISIKDQFGNEITITRDAEGNPTQITAPNGQKTYLTVDEQGNLTEIRYEDNSRYKFTYFDGSLMDVMTDPNGNQIQHIFDDNGHIIEEVDGEEGSYQFIKNITGNKTFYSIVQPMGETRTIRDIMLANGDTQSLITLPSGDTITATFSKDEKTVMSQKDGVSTVTTYTTDTLTHQKILASKEVTQPSGLKQSITYAISYDGNQTHTNSKTQTMTSNAKTTTIVSDYINGTDTLTTPMGKTATRLFDTATLLTKEIHAGSLNTLAFTYDAKGRLTQELFGTRATSYTYDSRGNVATITDAKGQSTSFAYDVMDRVTQITHPNGVKESYSYDSNGNMIKLVTPTPSEHIFTYNGVDQRLSMTSPLGKATQYTYDKDRRITSILKPSGKSINYSYDNDRLTTMQSPEDNYAFTYAFGDKIASLTKGSEAMSYTYDGTLLMALNQSGVLNQTLSYGYNNDFGVASFTYAGATQAYTYDNDGLLTSAGTYTFTRDTQNGFVTALTDGTLTQSRTYNDYGELMSLSDNTFGYTLQRDALGLISQKQESLDGSDTTYAYTYDSNGKLITVKKDGIEVESYTYDPNGNRASATINGITTTASYTLDDQLVVYGNNTYAYDDDGYLSQKTTPDGVTSYTYGTLGELREVQTPTQTIT
ncbi:MAG: hypothetical protein P8Y49_06285, partial [Sulfurovaceae bacterium]